MAGAAWVSILFEVPAIKQKRKANSRTAIGIVNSINSVGPRSQCQKDQRGGEKAVGAITKDAGLVFKRQIVVSSL